jgi:hypothetical protein
MQAAILISQAIVIGLIVVGGFWLRTIVRQQLAAKDATAEALRTEMQRLRSLAAPSLVAEIERLSQFAEWSQRTVNTVTEELNKLKTGGVSPDKPGVRIERYFDVLIFGMELMSRSIMKGLDMARERHPDETVKPVIDALKAVNKTVLEAVRVGAADAARQLVAEGAKYVILD